MYLTIERVNRTCLRYVHLRLIGECVGDIDISVLEETCCPPRSILGTNIGKPRVYVGHLGTKSLSQPKWIV